jgi:hypothetical protein
MYNMFGAIIGSSAECIENVVLLVNTRQYNPSASSSSTAKTSLKQK